MTLPKASVGRLQVQFLVLEALSLAACVAGFVSASRPLIWLGGLLSSGAMWVVLRGMAHKTARPVPSLMLVALAPALVLCALSFVMLPPGAEGPAPVPATPR